MKYKNNIYPDHIYKGFFFQDLPQLIYLGMQDQYYTFNMFDTQAWLARDYMMGKFEMPSKEERRKDIDAWLEEYAKVKTANDDVDFQAAYIKDLISYTDYPDFNVDKVGEMLKEWWQDKEDNILTNRDKNFRSLVTGTKAEEHHTNWMDELDDSKKRYLMDEYQLERLKDNQRKLEETRV